MAWPAATGRCTHFTASALAPVTWLPSLAPGVDLVHAMCHAGAQALASRVACAGEPADKEKAILALDAMLYTEINQPDVRSPSMSAFKS